MISPWYIGPPNASILPGVMRRVPYQHRVLEYAKPNKMIYEVEKRLKKYALHSARQRGQVLPSMMEFKNHTAMVHNIFLHEYPVVGLALG